SERLFDDHPPPLAIGGLRRQSRGPELLDDGSVDRGRNREIKERAAAAVDFSQPSLQPLVQRCVAKVAADVVHALSERARNLVLLLQPRKLAQARAENGPQPIVRHGVTGDTYHRE